MTDVEFQYECRVCGISARFWRLKCPACGREGKLRSRMAGHAELRARIRPLNMMTREHPPRVSTAMTCVDLVLGGGAVPGAVNLIVGDRGVGKSTLLLQVCVGLSMTLPRVLFVSGEEHESQFSRLVARLGYGDTSRVSFLQSEWIEELLWAADVHRPQAMVVDSAQAFASPSEKGQRGGTAQIRRLTRDLVRLAKQNNITVFLVGQTNDDGSVAGPKKLEFWVDAVIRYRRVARSAELREITADKNRFGKEGDRYILAMTANGLLDTGEVITSESRAAARKERDRDDDDRAERRGAKKGKKKGKASSRPSSRPPPPVPQRAIPMNPGDDSSTVVLMDDPVIPPSPLLPRTPPKPFTPTIVRKQPVPSPPRLRVVPNPPEPLPSDEDAVEPGAVRTPPSAAFVADTPMPTEAESDPTEPEEESFEEDADETEGDDASDEEEEGEEAEDGAEPDEDPAAINRKKILLEHEKKKAAEAKFFQDGVDAAKREAEALKISVEFQREMGIAEDEIERRIREAFETPKPDPTEPDGSP